MKNFTKEELEEIILNGDPQSVEAYRLGYYLEEVMSNDGVFEQACTDPKFLPITIKVGIRVFKFIWAADIVNGLDALCEHIIDEI